MTVQPGDHIVITATEDQRLHIDTVYRVFEVDEFGHVWLEDSNAHLCHVLGDRWEPVS